MEPPVGFVSLEDRYRNAVSQNNSTGLCRWSPRSTLTAESYEWGYTAYHWTEGYDGKYPGKLGSPDVSVGR